MARRGSPAPGTSSGVHFDAFSLSSWPVLNDAGQTAFRGNLTGAGVTSTNNRGIWVEDADTLELVARTGDPAPGTAVGVRFSDLALPTLNSAGQTAFRANLTGTGVFSSNNLGIWATDQRGALQLIARTGAQLEVTPGVFRTLSDVAFVGITGNSDGRASGFNNLGQLVFWARFTDGSQGVFVSSAVAHLRGDFNGDGVVDGADLVQWKDDFGIDADSDTDGDGDSDGEDFLAWQRGLGSSLSPSPAERLPMPVPEPAGIAVAAVIFGVITMRSRHGLKITSCVNLALTVAAGAAIQLAPTSAARGSTLELDASAKSPAEIAFDPDASFEIRSAFICRLFSNVKGPLIGGTSINTLLGADAFYSHGYTGAGAVMANIEAGHIWSGHETLTHVQQILNHPLALNEFDRHATWVGSIMGGRQGGANPGPYQDGMAPDAQLYSGAMNTQCYATQRAPAGRTTP